MSPKIFKYAGVSALFVVAIGAGLWYFLAPPKAQPIDVHEVESPGIITGTISYPSDFVPSQKVCAQSVSDKLYERCTDVPEQVGSVASTFSIKVTPDTYTVYAMLKDPSEMGLTESRRAYWTEFVRCGATTACTSHEHLQVAVGAGKTVLDIRPQDWYEN